MKVFVFYLILIIREILQVVVAKHLLMYLFLYLFVKKQNRKNLFTVKNTNHNSNERKQKENNLIISALFFPLKLILTTRSTHRMQNFTKVIGSIMVK